MAKFGDLTRNQEEDLLSKVESACGGNGIARFQASELMLVERVPPATTAGGDNGGISPYLSGLNVEAFIVDWRTFYWEVHSMIMDPTDLMKRLPPITPGFNWGIWTPQDMMPQRAYEMADAMFTCWKRKSNHSLDQAIDMAKERRKSDQQYVIWAKDRVEADDELKNTSANQIDKKGINTMTLIERLILEQWFFWKSGGKHLDVQNMTRCSGSRFSDGSVPSVDWFTALGIRVDRCHADDRFGVIRSREVVSAAA